MIGRSLRRAALAAAAVLVVGGGAALADEGSPWGLRPENIGTYGKDIDSLYILILWITGVTFVLTQVLLVAFLVKFRARPGGKAVYLHGNHSLEVVWTIVPGVILFALALVQSGTWSAIKIRMPADSEGPVLHVLAQRFNWNIRYAGRDGLFGTPDDVTDLRVLHVPVDAKVIVHLRSIDVIHSFFLPNLRLKQDVVPGLTIRQWFEAKKTTMQARKERDNPRFNFELACAELCGEAHYDMWGKLVVHRDTDDDVDEAPDDRVYHAGLSYRGWLRQKAVEQEGVEPPAVWRPRKVDGVVREAWPVTKQDVDTWTKWTK